MEGLLEKRGTLNTAFKQRWFVLRPGNLRCYDDKEMRAVKNSIPLTHDVVIVEMTTSESNVFEIRCPGRTYALRAADEPAYKQVV